MRHTALPGSKPHGEVCGGQNMSRDVLQEGLATTLELCHLIQAKQDSSLASGAMIRAYMAATPVAVLLTPRVLRGGETTYSPTGVEEDVGSLVPRG